jgi:uncharacterized protein (DUF885 family)
MTASRSTTALREQIDLALTPARLFWKPWSGSAGNTTVADALEQRDAATTRAEQDRQLRALAEAAAQTAADEAATAVRAATDAAASQAAHVEQARRSRHGGAVWRRLLHRRSG